MLVIAESAFLAPWLFSAFINTRPTWLWDSPEEARRQATHIARVLLYASSIALPLAASAYGAMASRWRILKGLLGLVVGAALCAGNFECLVYVSDPGA